MLDGDATCHDQQVFNDTELWARIKIPGTKDDYEELETISGTVFEYDYPPKKKEEPKKDEEEAE